MKYMVLVNGKFFVKVDVDGSKAAAEHSILDNFDGITGAQAFDETDMTFKWFVRDWLLPHELISMDELKEKTDRYTDAWKEYAEMKRLHDTKQDEINSLRDELMDLEEAQKNLESEMRKIYISANEANAALNIKD